VENETKAIEEKVAAVIRDHNGCGAMFNGKVVFCDDDRLDLVNVCDCHHAARKVINAHLSALSAAGLVIVPREPTETMLRVALRTPAESYWRDHYGAIYRAMIAASSPDHEEE
jgi:hypothetical protein